MNDDTLLGAPTAAEQAVTHLLVRMGRDANLRWYLFGTEAFRLLCVAEAHRLVRTVKEVERSIEREAALSEDVADVVLLTRSLEKKEAVIP
jgi:hypothetical protein